MIVKILLGLGILLAILFALLIIAIFVLLWLFPDDFDGRIPD